jgi:glycerol-3-phosphate O-acyltransferase
MDAQRPAWTPGARLILSAASTPVERELIERWARDSQPPAEGEVAAVSAKGGPGTDVAPGGEEGPGAGSGGHAPSLTTAEVIDLRDTQLAARLRTGDDPLLVPVRVTWLPKEREGRRQAGWSDILALRDPRRPSRRRQGRIAERDADGYRIVAGEPARVSELRARFAQRSGDARADPAALARFVVRQATFALERAERAVIGDRYKVPRLVVEEITSGRQFQARVAALADRLGMDRERAGRRAASALRELAAVQSRLAIDIFTTAMRPLHARAWTVRVEGAEFEQLRELNRRHALIFLPSHRSYADPLVLADALLGHDFPRNHVVSGDNLSFFPFGPLARRAGVVFMRRSFRDDEIYKLAIQEYFGFLVAKRFNLEWYFEGGRSRTGKLRPPKYGLLRYVATALLADPALDVYLVPVSITYERLFEVSDMAAEQAGWVKPREGLKALARYARGQAHASGGAVVRFAPPFAMRPALPTGGGDDAELRPALSKIAFEVAVAINNATPVLPGSLVTLALLGVRDRALTLAEVGTVLAPVLDYVRARRLPELNVEPLRGPVHLDGALHDLERAKVVTFYGGGEEGVFSISPGQHLVAAFYRNNSIHWFVNRAIVELAMITVAEEGSGAPLTAAWEAALRLRDLLKYEFFFPDKDAFRTELIAEIELIDPQWSERAGSAEQARELLRDSGFLMAHRVLRSFLEAELVVALRLQAHPAADEVDQKALLAECSGVGQQLLLQGRIHSAEALSRELFASALKLAEGRGLLGPATDPAAAGDLAAARARFAEEVSAVVRRIGVAADIDSERTPSSGSQSFR